MRFVFEADMYKGECSHCPCHYNDMADNDRCGVDNAITCGWVEKLDCPLEEASVLDWHPYPQQEPSEDGLYLLTCDIGVGVIVTFGRWFLDEFVYLETDGKVIAWAYLPEPYKEEK